MHYLIFINVLVYEKMWERKDRDVAMGDLSLKSAFIET